VDVLVHPGPAEETIEHLRRLGVHARAVGELATATVDGDVIVVRRGARVGAGFAERLAAAATDGVTATVAALALPEGDPDVVARRSLKLHARTTRLTFDCTWVSGAAAALAGPLDEGFGRRCSELGLVHVVADDVLVTGVPPTDPSDPLDREEIPPLPPRPLTRLHRALAWTRRVVDGLDLTIDGRVLREMRSGTEIQALALIEALVRTDAARVRVLVTSEAPELPDVETFVETDGVRRSALVHRPYQVSSADDLRQLGLVGERLVVTHQDLLLYHDPAYHRSADAWAGYRRLTGAALAAADAVVAITDHVGRDLLAEDLVHPGRLTTVYQGTDHDRPGEAVAPAGLEALAGRPFIVQLGTDLRHKNRPFSIALLSELRRLGWPGALVLAGPGVEHGSSARAEDALVDGDLAAHVVRLGAVTDEQRRWLYREAAAVAFPSVSEGFGLIPFEAAAAGTPPLVAHVSAMAELLPAELALLLPWDPVASAGRVLAVLHDPAPLTRAVHEIGQRLTWDRTAAALLKVYDDVFALPSRRAVISARETLAAEARRGHWEGRYWALRDEVGPTGLALVGRDGVLPEDAQRALVALTRRRLTRGPLLKTLRATARLGRTR
jgi:glycosyltransferase involved in cell wall biosynthesis